MSLEKYKKLNKLGEGTYAVVYRATDETGNEVAIKKIKISQFKDGLDMSAIREIKQLQVLKHPNIILFLGAFSSKSSLNLVLELIQTDLEVLIKNKQIVFNSGDIKSWMLMLINGIKWCHENFVLHRVF